MFSASVITISDSASRDALLDTAGPAAKQLLLRGGRFRCSDPFIVPDEKLDIQNAIRSAPGPLVITCGGTGFGRRDCTPEAVAPLLDRPAPGIVHLLLASSLAHTPYAALSRPVAGTIRERLIVTLPGSLKAVTECLEALLASNVLEHALELTTGGDGAATHWRILHSASAPSMSRTLAHGCDHHVGHSAPQPLTARRSHDPALPVTVRSRVSPYPLISFENALGIIFEHCALLQPTTQRVGPSLRGLVLAEDVVAVHDVPPTMTTSVDGYALQSSDPSASYKVLTGHPLKEPLPPRSVYRINTGAPLPAGCDSVIMVEDTILESCTTDASGVDIEEEMVRTLAQPPAFENVRLPGSDVRRGEVVMRQGQLVTAGGGEVGTLAFIGRKEVSVIRRPTVALISTGNELRDIQRQDASAADDGGWSGVWDTNRPSLQAALEGLGYADVKDFGIIDDNLAAHAKAFSEALESADVVISTGGSSMGSSDLLKPVIEHCLGGTIHFGRVSVKPGKPTTFATVPSRDGASKLLFGLPGNPVSALVCFYLFVVPALRKMGGHTSAELPRVRVKLADAMQLDPRPEFQRVRIRSQAGELVAFSTGGQRSSRMASLCGANGLVALPARESGTSKTMMQPGQFADAVLIGEIET